MCYSSGKFSVQTEEILFIYSQCQLRSMRWVRAGLIALLLCGGWFVGARSNGGVAAFAATFTSEMQLGTIEGQVWKDTNWDGVQQLSDPFIPYTIVTLYRSEEMQGPGTAQPPTLTATPLLTTTTTITGWYQFRGLEVGAYYLGFMTPGSMAPTRDNVGADEATDSDIVNSNATLKGRYGPFMIANTGRTLEIDAGFVAAAQSTIYVYEDINRDQKRQVDEPAVPGAIVLLYTTLENIATRYEIDRTVVDNKGAAKFVDLRPGQYSMEVWPPEGYLVSQRNQLTDLSLQPGANSRIEAAVYRVPNAIDLVSFIVKRQNGALYVRWVTAAEQYTYGYRLVQQDTVAAADAVQFTSELIPSQGSWGGVYEMELSDNQVYDAPDETLIFWLVEYEITGNQNRYGPFSVTSSPSTWLFLPLIVQK